MTSLRDSAPVRWWRRWREYVRRSNEEHGWSPTVSFDDARVWVVRVSGEDDGFPWESVRRIGYRTTDSWGSDHFLEFQLADGRVVSIETGGPGALALCEHVDHLPDTRFVPGRGSLANVIGDDSIVVWPSREAGRSLDA